MDADSSRSLPSTAAAEFTQSGALRQNFGVGGRVHVDRPLPFLVLNRFDPDAGHSLAERVAVTSSAYAIWTEAEDAEAIEMVETVVARHAAQFDRFLLISLYDLPLSESLAEDAPALPDFVAHIGASDDEAAEAAAAALDDAMAVITVDLRTCTVEHLSRPYFEPGIETLIDADRTVSHISLGLPQNYRRPDRNGIYPQLYHELAIGVFDALLKAACVFIDRTSAKAPAHHRSLGRSAFIAAAQSVDRKLDRVCCSFDLLLSVSPINTTEALARFVSDKCEKPPVFRYRPLTVDPELAKRALYRVDVRTVEDPVLEHLFSEKRREVDQQLTMLECRNTDDFRFASLILYGAVEPPLLKAAKQILDSDAMASPIRDSVADCHAVKRAAHKLAARYREHDERFDPKIELRDDIAPGLMVSGGKLLISTATRMPKRRVDPLLQHEMSVHVLTHLNGAEQGLAMFRTGLAGYDGVQEGLGVFAEWAVGGLTRARLRLLAARVVAVDAMIGGAGFIDTFRTLHDTHGFTVRGAFGIVSRIYRSGGFAKDAIYLRGFKTVLDLVAKRHDLTPFWFGKIAPHHVGVVEELAQRGLLRAPVFTPEFMVRDDAKARIAKFAADPNFAAL